MDGRKHLLGKPGAFCWPHVLGTDSNANAKRTTFSLTSTAWCSSHEYPQELLKSWQVLQKWTRMSWRGPTTWEGHAPKCLEWYSEFAKQKTSSNCNTKFPHLVSTTASSRNRNWKRLEKCLSLLWHRSEMFLFGVHQQTWRSLVCKQTYTGSHEKRTTDFSSVWFHAFITWRTVQTGIMFGFWCVWGVEKTQDRYRKDFS